MLLIVPLATTSQVGEVLGLDNPPPQPGLVQVSLPTQQRRSGKEGTLEEVVVACGPQIPRHRDGLVLDPHLSPLDHNGLVLDPHLDLHPAPMDQDGMVLGPYLDLHPAPPDQGGTVLHPSKI